MKEFNVILHNLTLLCLLQIFTNGLPEIYVVGSAAQQIQYLRQEESNRRSIIFI